MSKSYTVNEIFYSLQGEGVRAGTANVFVRFTGCNQTCAVETHGFDCDTEFASGRKLVLSELVAEVREIAGSCRWIVLTGGEPALQIDQDLLLAFHEAGFKIAIETNGSLALPAGIDWITVSPKVAEHAIRQRFAHEVKYVRNFGQGIPKPVVESEHKLISPASSAQGIDRKALEWSIQLVRDNPPWRLSIQQHKIWNVR